MIRAAFLILTLSASTCVAPVSDGGCLAYGAQRGTMPPLGMSPLDDWVAVLDTSMTGACFP